MSRQRPARGTAQWSIGNSSGVLLVPALCRGPGSRLHGVRLPAGASIGNGPVTTAAPTMPRRRSLVQVLLAVRLPPWLLLRWRPPQHFVLRAAPGVETAGRPAAAPGSAILGRGAPRRARRRRCGVDAERRRPPSQCHGVCRRRGEAARPLARRWRRHRPRRRRPLSPVFRRPRAWQPRRRILPWMVLQKGDIARLGAAGGSATPLGQAASPVLRLGRRCADSLPPRLLLPLRAAGAGGIRVPRASRLPVTPPAASAGAAVHLAERGQRLPRRRRLLRRQRRPLRVGQRRCAAKELPPRQTIRVAKLLLLLRPPLGRSPGGGAGQRAVKLVGRRRSQVGGAVMLRADCSLPAAAAAVQEAVGDGGAVRGRRRLRRRMRAAEGDARLVRGCAAACVPAVKNVIQETCLAA